MVADDLGTISRSGNAEVTSPQIHYLHYRKSDGCYIDVILVLGFVFGILDVLNLPLTSHPCAQRVIFKGWHCTNLGGGFKYFWNFHPECLGKWNPI